MTRERLAGLLGAVLAMLGLWAFFLIPTLIEVRDEAVLADATEYRVLILGKDDAAELTDVMMLASFDLETPSLSVMQIPRDTYLAYTTANYKKINGAVRSLGGEDALCDFLGKALGVSIDGYVSFDLAFVEDVVDMLGGVEVDVPFDMDYDDPYQELSIHLKKGLQTLSGREATHFIRYRSGYLRGDLGRIDAQKLFVASFLRAFLAKGDGGDLPRAAMLVAKYLRTDMRVDTLVALTGIVKRVSPADVTLLTLPGEEVQSQYSGAWYYVLSRSGMREVMERFLGADGSVFDSQRQFVDQKRSSFREIYEKNIPPEAYTAEELLGGGLQIENQ